MYVFTEITTQMLEGKPQFHAVATAMNQWFAKHMQGGKAGVLVSHNTSVDIQFLLCEYIRAKVKLPTGIKLGLDTCATLKRFASLQYRKVSVEDWPTDGLTAKGKPSMGVKPCATYALSRRIPPERFEDVCGDHHDAEADTRAVAVILFDQEQFGNRGLYHCVFKTKKKCFQPITEVWDAMKAKMTEPVIELEPPPEGWVSAPVCTGKQSCVCVYSVANHIPHSHMYSSSNTIV